MAREARPPDADFLKDVERLADEGYSKGEIAERLGFRSTTTFSSRLVKASQHARKPIPAFRTRAGGAGQRVEHITVKARGPRSSFGAYLPREPLERLGVQPGDTLTVTVGRRRIVLALPREEEPAEREPRGPRLVKRRREE